MVPDITIDRAPMQRPRTSPSPKELFLGKFKRTMTGTRFPLPVPWISVLNQDAEWLWAFEVRELPEVICLTTESFVADRLYPVMRISREQPGALLVTADRAHRYRPVPVDAQHRVTLSEVPAAFGKPEPNRTVPIIVYGGADHFGVCQESDFSDVQRKLELEAQKAAGWAAEAAQAMSAS